MPGNINSDLISIITDLQNNIIYTSSDASMFIGIALKDININFYQKKIIANILDKNYTVYKIKLTINSQLLVQYFFEEFRLNYISTAATNRLKLATNRRLCFESFSELEQEVIYSLLNGHTTDKCIIQFLRSIKESAVKGNIKYTISSLYNKFSCDNRIDLISTLRHHEFDRNLPKSIFPSGIYDY
jgi:hypothetical protein